MKIKKAIDKFDAIMESVESYLVFLLLFAMLFFVFIGVIFRYGFGFTLSWGEELPRYIMIWATFIGASLGVKKGSHISVDALEAFLPLAAKRVVVVISYVISLAFCIVILAIGVPFIGSLADSGQLSPALRIPMYFAYLAVLIGIGMMAIRYLLLLIFELFYPQSSEFSVQNQNKEDPLSGRGGFVE
ncbi:TRAP transporter small permease [Alkalihalobacillus oceani]|uniref:TRAP transporter small permease n=1 Tax=Halalkalibacter oceani TaxID=1653776 RepID=A0A9X2IR71_9BACI|nr:TRAP transporter small permease [Halalkalibacter oceani]MCM3716167.1 TRAP transporter small permease [Halalkalibacter oceani]